MCNCGSATEKNITLSLEMPAISNNKIRISLNCIYIYLFFYSYYCLLYGSKLQFRNKQRITKFLKELFFDQYFPCPLNICEEVTLLFSQFFNNFQFVCAALNVSVCLKQHVEFLLPCIYTCIFISFYSGIYVYFTLKKDV